MTIRPLLTSELPLAVDGGYEFFDEGKMPGGFKPEAFIANWTRLIDNGHGAILGSWEGEQLTGVIGAVLAPDLWNGQLMAVECLWYVRAQYRGHGMKLLLEFEKWAKEKGAVRTAMIHLERLQPEALAILYKRMGYEKIETHYVKELNERILCQS